jgi:hypothetical protein
MPITADTVDSLFVQPMTAFHQRFESASTDSLTWLRELEKTLTFEDHNGFRLQPSAWAFENARYFLDAASERLRIPVPEFTPDGERGLDIEWEIAGRRLALSCRGNNTDVDFISWREPQGRYDGLPASSSLLVEKLIWLTT